MAFFFVLLLIALAFAAGYAVAVARSRRLAPPPPPEAAAPVTALTHEAKAPESTRVAFERDAEEGTTAWRLAMADVGARMKQAGVKLVVFAHGSFVGDDPLTIARTVEDAIPALAGHARALRGFTRAQVHRFLGDLSNFTPEYVAGFAQATGVAATSFTWSGENHHAGRVQGAVRLARAIALYGGGAIGPGDRVLLVGHSHGGQLFAVLSQLLAGAEGHEELVAAARARGEDPGALADHLAQLRAVDFDVATFGTPPRYGWARGARFRVLHLVNHRGAAPRGRSLLGVFHTREGDYVHRVGVPGSDFPALAPQERAINARLDRILGHGWSPRVWLGHVARGLRVAPHGHTILVDYGDDARAVPNLLATGLGHAAYTRRDAMLFHARLVAGHFYSPPAPTPWVDRVRGLLPPKRLLAAPARRLPSSPEM
jgi:hypothetical protein